MDRHSKNKQRISFYVDRKVVVYFGKMCKFHKASRTELLTYLMETYQFVGQPKMSFERWRQSKSTTQ